MDHLGALQQGLLESGSPERVKGEHSVQQASTGREKEAKRAKLEAKKTKMVLWDLKE